MSEDKETYEIISFEGKTYLTWVGRKIKEGDLAWNPISEAIIEIDSEDDIHYVNSNYCLVAAVDTGAGDARLIAAAPELHAQAKILERLLIELAMQGETGTDEALEEVRAVLAKVDGGEG